MTDFTKNLEIGDKLFFKGYPEFYGEDCPLERNDIGVVIGYEENKIQLAFEGKGTYWIFAFDIAPYKDIRGMNPIEKIQWEYEEWVDEYTDMLEKSHVTMEEVQWKYSRLALSWVIRELKVLGTEEANKRIEYLETLYEHK